MRTHLDYVNHRREGSVRVEKHTPDEWGWGDAGLRGRPYLSSGEAKTVLSQRLGRVPPVRRIRLIKVGH